MLPANNLPKHARHHVGLILALAGLVSAATLVPGPARLASAQAVAPSSSFPGNLNTAREGHTATLLPNGNAAGATRSSTEPNAARPRPEPPEALFFSSADKLSPLDKTYLDAFSILRKNTACSRFFGGSRAIVVLNDLKQQLKTTYFDSSIAMRMRGRTISITSGTYGFDYRLFAKAELNSQGPFFNANLFRYDASVLTIGGFAPTTREARITILLHELGHLIESSDKHWLLPNDGKNPSLSDQNTQRIITICGEEIRHLKSINFAQQLLAVRSAPTASALQANVLAQ